MSWSRLATVRSSFRRLAEYTSASCVRAQKSRYRPIRLRSQLYSSCFVRHICASCFPCPGNRSSQSEVTENTSNSVPYASNTSAFIGSFLLQQIHLNHTRCDKSPAPRTNAYRFEISKRRKPPQSPVSMRARQGQVGVRS